MPEAESKRSGNSQREQEESFAGPFPFDVAVAVIDGMVMDDMILWGLAFAGQDGLERRRKGGICLPVQDRVQDHEPLTVRGMGPKAFGFIQS